ncbi:hypothetical protein COU59_03085 [Candidatus Pacearchaeota archaeon CG10_big_fil_rev_8_21_14_0_10_34_12]|nr:MAG: hypothetical protein COU59_03085 [Candidatus Pacearchaeota archaeon CG10_big_fil_rev_8_21_14_0_10_34_12]
MKILVIGDFHGKIPKGLNKLIEKENIDLVVSLGDYAPFYYRKLWFKHCYGKDIELWEVIGKKKYKELVLEDLRRAEKVLKSLNNLSVPVFTVLGNVDWSAADDIVDIKKPKGKRYWKWEEERLRIFQKLLKKYKNIKRFDYRFLKFGDYIFIGMRGHSAPGKVKSKAFRKYKQKLENLFKKFSKENKQGKVIFVSHNIAHNTKLDKLSMKSVKFAQKSAGIENEKDVKRRRRHYGSKMARRIIEKWQPILHLGGHIHEAWGKDKIGKTTLINPGAVPEGKSAIITLDKEKGKVKNIRFLR